MSLGQWPERERRDRALGFTAFAGGLVVGPSLGYFYAGQSGRAWQGVGLRALGSRQHAAGLAVQLTF